MAVRRSRNARDVVRNAGVELSRQALAYALALAAVLELAQSSQTRTTHHG
jgi:hypothetical protein